MAHEITSVEGDLVDLLYKTSTTPICNGYVKVDGFLFPESYKNFADAVENFKVRDDDIWVSSFLKTGSTWTQEMVWCIANDLDFEQAKIPLAERFPFLETSCWVDFIELMEKNPDLNISESVLDSIETIRKMPSPRFIKTHLPFDLLPRQIRTGEKKPKIVYVVRNPKDVCISYFHHRRLLGTYTGNFEEFCDLFIGDLVPAAPFWKHALGYWEKRIQENVLFLKYEDMKKNLPWVMNKTANFLGKKLTTDQLSSLTEHLSFANMKVNPALNYKEAISILQRITKTNVQGEFMRNGNSDQWKTDMSLGNIERFDNWIRQNLEGTRLIY